jgi:hypothetical protein
VPAGLATATGAMGRNRFNLLPIGAVFFLVAIKFKFKNKKARPMVGLAKIYD